MLQFTHASRLRFEYVYTSAQVDVCSRCGENLLSSSFTPSDNLCSEILFAGIWSIQRARQPEGEPSPDTYIKTVHRYNSVQATNRIMYFKEYSSIVIELWVKGLCLSTWSLGMER